MPSWYDHPLLPQWLRDVRSRFDILSFGFNTAEDEEGMMESKRLIEQLVTDEVNSGTPPNRIFLGGFSQGGAMSLLVGLTGDRKFAALAILSSWLPLRKKFKAVCHRTPSFVWRIYLTRAFVIDGFAACFLDAFVLGIRIR